MIDHLPHIGNREECQDIVYCAPLGGLFDRGTMMHPPKLYHGLKAAIAPLNTICRDLWGATGTVMLMVNKPISYDGCVGGQPQTTRPKTKWVLVLDQPARISMLQNITVDMLL